MWFRLYPAHKSHPGLWTKIKDSIQTSSPRYSSTGVILRHRRPRLCILYMFIQKTIGLHVGYAFGICRPLPPGRRDECVCGWQLVHGSKIGPRSRLSAVVGLRTSILVPVHTNFRKRRLAYVFDLNEFSTISCTCLLYRMSVVKRSYGCRSL